MRLALPTQLEFWDFCSKGVHRDSGSTVMGHNAQQLTKESFSNNDSPFLSLLHSIEAFLCFLYGRQNINLGQRDSEMNPIGGTSVAVSHAALGQQTACSFVRSIQGG
jgi:hypothetical protein